MIAPRKGHLASLVLVASLACTSTKTPEQPKLELEFPDRFGQQQAPETTTEGLTAPSWSAWWKDFDAHQLDLVVERALANNPSLLLAVANLDAALAQVRIEGANRKPQLSTGLNGSRRKQNFIGFPIPGSEDSLLSTTSSNLSMSLNVTWEADLWGRLRAQQAAAVAEATAREADLASARLSIAGQSVKGWFGLVEARQQVDLLERTLETRRASGRRVQARYERGLVPSLDVRLARTQTEGVRAELAQGLQSLALARRQLEVLLGSYPEGTLEADPTLPDLPPALPRWLPAQLLRRRPDLRAAEQRAYASSARLRAAKRALYPSLSLTGSSGTASSELRDLLDGDFSVWSLAAGLLQPIFSGGRLRAGVSFQEAGLDAAEASWLQTALQAFFEVEAALDAERYLEQRVTALAEAARQSQAAERLALDRYNRGLNDYLNVLESQRSAFLSERQLIVARRQRLNARTDLILALGGGVLEEHITEKPRS